MFTDKRNQIQKRREMLPGQSSGTLLGERNWDAQSLNVAWDVETRSPDLKSMAFILIQTLRLHETQTDSHSAHPELVHAGQSR